MRVGQSSSNSVQNSEVSQSKQTGRAQAAGNAKKGEKSGAAAAAVSSGSVSTEISSKGKDLARAKEVAQSAPDIREEKVAELRRRIAAGQYKTDPEAIADRMVDEHLNMAGIG